MSTALAVASLHDRAAADALAQAGDPYKALLERVGNARLVMIGEASHGTHEFYRERIEITQRLIEEHGFAGVAVEADWPDAPRVNRYVSGTGDDADAADALDRSGCPLSRAGRLRGCATSSPARTRGELRRTLSPHRRPAL